MSSEMEQQTWYQVMIVVGVQSCLKLERSNGEGSSNAANVLGNQTKRQGLWFVDE
jgi:hypothetical protein